MVTGRILASSWSNLLIKFEILHQFLIILYSVLPPNLIIISLPAKILKFLFQRIFGWINNKNSCLGRLTNTGFWREPWQWIKCRNQVNNYLFLIDNGNTEKKCKIYLEVNNKDTRTTSLTSLCLASLVVTLNIFHTFF